MVSTIGEIIRDLLLFVGVVTVLLVFSLVIIAKLPAVNPLKYLFIRLAYRLGATAAAGILAIPIEPIPGLDALYDLGAPVLLLWYWFTFFRDMRRRTSDAPPRPQSWDNGARRPGRRP